MSEPISHKLWEKYNKAFAFNDKAAILAAPSGIAKPAADFF